MARISDSPTRFGPRDSDRDGPGPPCISTYRGPKSSRSGKGGELYLEKEDEYVVRQRLGTMESDVTIRYFSQKAGGDYSPENLQLLQMLTGMSSKLHLEVYDLQDDHRKAGAEKIAGAPATKLVGAEKRHIIFYGIPSGFEFLSLLEDILMVSRGDSGLNEGSRRRLRALRDPLHIRVFVTLDCPHCPGAARLAHQFAMENALVAAEVVEAVEFPELSEKYGVSSVPLTIVNGFGSVHGTLAEGAYLDAVLAASSSARSA